MPNRVTTPMINGYIPETDVTRELDKDGITFYQEIIGVIRWAIEIGRVYINTEISLLCSYQAAQYTLYFDPSHVVLDKRIFNSNNKEQF